MKLSSLLLSSAAVLVAGSAFAADLPSKKAAPASAVTVCKIGDATGIAIPGSDTCLSINGRVTYDVKYDGKAKGSDGKSDYTLSPGFRIGFDARSNTEIGVVRSFIRVDGGAAVGTGKAYIQFAGLTAGLKDSLSDIYGTTANIPTKAGSGSQGIDYQVGAGAFSFGFGVEDAQNNNTGGINGDRPDFVAQVKGGSGPVSATIAAVSHQSISGTDTNEGYALKGSISASFDPITVIAFGGTASGASAFIGGTTNITDYNGTDATESTGFGGEINVKLGKALIAFEAANYEHKLSGSTTEKVTEYNVFVNYALAKGLSIQPEYAVYDYTGGGVDSSTVQVRIKRDF